MQANDVLNFWFEESKPENWFKKDEAYDQLIKERFFPYYDAAIKGELFEWRKNIEGRLAEIILLDQFSRNMFRNSPLAFLFDPQALMLSQEASDLPEAKALAPTKRTLYWCELWNIGS